jgi:hypothetical protein
LLPESSLWGFGFMLRRFFTVTSNLSIRDPYAPFKPSISFDLVDQFSLSVGFLIMSWANLETLLRGIYCCVTNPKNTVHAEIIWLSINSNRARCDLLRRSLTAANIQPHFKAEITSIVEEFNSISKTRNFYAHAHYRVDPKTLTLSHVEGHQLNLDETIFTSKIKKASKGTLNELVFTVNRCNDINRRTYPVLLLLREAVGAQQLEMPLAPLGYANNPKFPLP